MKKVTKKELLRRIEALEEWSNGADEMLTELNHALPDPEYDAKCEERAVAVEESLARHTVRLGLKKPELTGSDLCRAMLERGDKWVLCLAANHPSNIDYDQIPDVVTEYISKGFMAGHYHWMYVVPINNQGEPLTAAEVGL